MEPFTPREQIIEVVNKLFVYTDERHWDKLQEEVFTKVVLLDMSSMGVNATTISSKEICEKWTQGFAALDAVNHLVGNHLVTLREKDADVFAYATATHFKKNTQNGNTREYVGTYLLHLIRKENGWRVDKFKYNLKYMTGNLDLE